MSRLPWQRAFIFARVGSDVAWSKRAIVRSLQNVPRVPIRQRNRGVELRRGMIQLQKNLVGMPKAGFALQLTHCHQSLLVVATAREKQEMYLNEHTQERRHLYRMTLGNEDRVEVSILTDSGDTLVGEVVDISAQGAALHVSRSRAPVLSLGESVSFPFTPRSQDDPVALKATVRSRNLMGKHWRYGFEFQLKSTVAMRFAEEFYGLFNRRHAFRVKPLPEEPVSVNLADLDESVSPMATARLHDVSATGLSVLVASDNDPSLAEDKVLQTTLRPPTSTRWLKLTGRIRHRTRRGSNLLYGVQFDPEHTEQFERDHEMLVDYIIHRQLQDLADHPGPSSPRPPLPLSRTTNVNSVPDRAGTA